MKYLLLHLLLLAGCDAVVSKTPYGEASQREEEVSCSKSGYCYTCMPGMMDMKMECKFKFSNHCSGKQNALVEHQKYKVVYESGNVEIRDVTNTIKTMEQCK